MSHVLDLHLHLHAPYPALLEETEQLLWDRNGKISKDGKPSHYKTETIRYALQVARKQLLIEKQRRDDTPAELTAEEEIAKS